MLIDLKTNNNDLVVENGDLVTISGSEELKHFLLTRLQWFYGEYPFDTSIGVRYFEDVLVKNPNIPNIETLFKNVISETDGVNKVKGFSFDYNAENRSASVYFEVDTKYGDIEQTLSLGV